VELYIAPFANKLNTAVIPIGMHMLNNPMAIAYKKI
jgi:hypothetical protein